MIYINSQFSSCQNEIDKYNIRSINDEIYLQRVLKSTISPSDETRCFENIFKHLPWI